jgi:Mrp family chromosome partitioning ATPase/uncharacterized protein involved in exopolysaccharide biosynthesis
VTTNNDQESPSPGLPVEPVTLLIGLVRRWKILAFAMVVSLVLGVVVAYTFGKQTYEAETIALYKLAERKDEGAGRTPPVSSQVWLVKIPSNLRTVSDTLQLEIDPKDLDKVFDVRVEKRTSLVFIKAQWDSAKMAANLANTLREAFFANQMDLIKADAGKEVKDLEIRLRKANQEYKEADEKLQHFVTENKIVDLNKEVQWNLDQMTALSLSLSNSKNEQDTLEIQKESLQERLETLKAKLAEEKSVTTQGKSLADLNIRIERLRRRIHDDKEARKNRVELEKDEQGFLRAQELFDKGLISKQDFEKAKAEYEAQQVKTIDTDQIVEWKRQLKVLEGEVIPQKDSFKSPTQEMYQSLQLKVLDMDLQQVSLKKKITYLNAQISQIKDKLEVLTALQRQYSSLTRELGARESRKMEIEQLLDKAHKDYDAPDPGFVTVSEARPPSQSIKSNRKIIFVAVVFLGTAVGFCVMLTLELLDTTIKSGAELQNKFGTPVIGLIPNIKPPQDLLPDGTGFALIELFRIIAHGVRREVPKQGARILITSTQRGEGRTLVAANLAACLGRQDERVLVMDAQIRPMESQTDLRYMIVEDDRPLRGLGEWLSFEVNEVEDIVWPTVLPGVECIPRIGASVTSDLLGSMRMKELLDDLTERFSLVLIDGPPVETYVDAELVAQLCDAVIFVVRSRACVSSPLKRSVERIRATQTPLPGFILNDVDRLYLKWA